MEAQILVFIITSVFISFLAFGEEFINIDIGGGATIKLPLVEISKNDERRLNKSNGENFKYKRRNSVKTSNSLKSRMSPVRNQGDRGTCPAFATIGLIEFFQGGDLSEQCLSKLSADEDGGFASRMIQWIRRNGLYLEKDCPYDPTETGRENIPDLSRAEKQDIDVFHYRTRSQEEPDLISFIEDQIDSGSPVVIAVYVAGDWNEQEIIEPPSDGDLWRNCRLSSHGIASKGKKCGIHVVTVTGYNNDSEYLEFKNSWGKKWPESRDEADGYGKISYAYFLKMRAGNHSMVYR